VAELGRDHRSLTLVSRGAILPANGDVRPALDVFPGKGGQDVGRANVFEIMVSYPLGSGDRVSTNTPGACGYGARVRECRIDGSVEYVPGA